MEAPFDCFGATLATSGPTAPRPSRASFTSNSRGRLGRRNQNSHASLSHFQQRFLQGWSRSIRSFSPKIILLSSPDHDARQAFCYRNLVFRACFSMTSSQRRRSARACCR